MTTLKERTEIIIYIYGTVSILLLLLLVCFVLNFSYTPINPEFSFRCKEKNRDVTWTENTAQCDSLKDFDENYDNR